MRTRIVVDLCVVALIVCVVLITVGYSEANKDPISISRQIDYPEREQRLTVYNTQTDKVIFEAEGYMTISDNDHGELTMTVQTGPDTYRKNYVYLSDHTMYLLEDIAGTETDPYRYKLYWHTDPSSGTWP